MSLTFKKALVALTVLITAVAYPLVSSGKNPNRILLTKDNTVSLNGEINPDSVANTILALQKLDSKSKSDKPIYLFIYSPGGDIQSGLELIEAAKGLNRPVDTIVLFAASMAFQITENLGTRNIFKNGVLMSHRAAGGFEGYFGGEQPSQLDSRYSFWLQRLKELDEQTVARTNGKQTLQSYQKQYANETWMTGEQAVEGGYADNIVNVHCDSSLSGLDHKSASFMGVNFTYDVSYCPLITSPMNVQVVGGDKIDSRYIEEVKTKFTDKFNLEGTVK